MTGDKLKWRVSTEQVLEALRYFSAADLRAQQSKLTGTATQLKQLLDGRLSHLLSEEEVENIRVTEDLVQQLNLRVEHAKEIKKREEQKKEKARKLHQAAIDKALDKALPPITRDATNIGSRIISLTELLLAFHSQKIILHYLSTPELVSDIRRKVEKYAARSDSLWEVGDYLYRDLRGALDSFLGWAKDETPEQKLSEILELARGDVAGIRKSQADLFAYVEGQVAIEESSNVQRLRGKPTR